MGTLRQPPAPRRLGVRPYSASGGSVDITSAQCAAGMPGSGGGSPQWQLRRPADRVGRLRANHRLEAVPGRPAPATSSHRPDPARHNGQSPRPPESGRADQAASGREARDSNRTRVRSDAQLSLHLVRGMSSTGHAIRDPFFDRPHRLIAQLLPVQRQRRHGCAPRTSAPGQGFQNPRRNGGLRIRESIHQIVEPFSGRRFHGSNLAHPSRPDPMVPAGKRRRRTGRQPARNAPHARSGASPTASIYSCSTPAA